MVRAAVTRFARLSGGGGGAPACALRVRTTIPRQLGLAGSSAIVIATLRALAAATRTQLPPRTLAAEALAAETEELGIAAGPQDRLVQAFEGLLYMDFGAGDVERLPVEALPRLFVAHVDGTGAPSGGVHGALRRRFAAGDPHVVDTMRRLADLTAEARRALTAGAKPRRSRSWSASRSTCAPRCSTSTRRRRWGSRSPAPTACTRTTRGPGVRSSWWRLGGPRSRRPRRRLRARRLAPARAGGRALAPEEDGELLDHEGVVGELRQARDGHDADHADVADA